jgi:hypothetical protein
MECIIYVRGNCECGTCHKYGVYTICERQWWSKCNGITLFRDKYMREHCQESTYHIWDIQLWGTIANIIHITYYIYQYGVTMFKKMHITYDK